MNEDHYIEVATSSSDALIKVTGLADMHIAPTLDDLTIMLAREGCSHLAIDLSACTGMDSTFMGTLISINVRYSDDNHWMCLINVTPDNQSLLKMLGVWGMVQVREKFEIQPVKSAKIRPPSEDFADRRMQIVEQAHQRLIEISADNQERFGPFLDALRSSLKDQQHG